MRLFIAVNLPETVKDGIEEKLEKIRMMPLNFTARFLTRKNWHLTITFLGEQPEAALGPILDSVKEIAALFETPEIEFEKIVYGPPDAASRMIWLIGSSETSRRLAQIKKELEKKLEEKNVRFSKEYRDFNAHLTLARFRQPLIRLKERLLAAAPFSFNPQSLDLMQSCLRRGGAEYEIAAEFDFKK